MNRQITTEVNFMAGVFKQPAIFWVTLIPLAFYLATLCPTVYGGDSAELIAAAYTLGIAHIPGHPLYVLIGKLFSYLPVGEVAYRLNFMSAVFAALALGVLFGLQNLLFASPTKSAFPTFEKTVLTTLAVLAFGFSETFWHYATTAETYTLWIFFFAVLLVFLIRFDATKDIRLLYGFSFIFGLSLGCTMSGTVLIPAFFYLIFSAKNSRLNVSRLIFCALFWLLGFSIYAFVPLRMLTHPDLHFGNTDSFSKLIYQLSGGVYRTGTGDFNIHKALSRIGHSASWFLEEFRYGLAPFIAIGAVSLARANRRLFLFSLIVSTSIIVGSIWAHNFDLSIDKKSYYLPIFFLFSIFVAAGFMSVRTWMKQRNLSPVLFYAVLSAVLCLEIVGNYKRADKHDNYLFYDMAKSAFETAEPNAVIFLDAEWLIAPMIYLRVVEGARPDVTLYDRTDNVFESFYRFSAPDLASNLRERDRQEDEFITNTKRPVYFTKYRQLKNAGGASLTPEGLLYRAVPSIGQSSQMVVKSNKSEPGKTEDSFSNYRIRGLTEKRFERDPSSRRILAHYYFLKGEGFLSEGSEAVVADGSEAVVADGSEAVVADGSEAVVVDEDQRRAFEALKKGESLVVELYEQLDMLAYIYYRYGFFAEAIRIFEKGIDLFPDYAPTYKNIGILYYEKLNKHELAKAYFKKYLEVSPDASDREVFLNLIQGVAGVLG